MEVLIWDEHVLFAEAFASVLTARGHRAFGYPSRSATAPPRPAGFGRPDVCVADTGSTPATALREIRRLVEPARILVLTAEEDPVSLRTVIAGNVNGLVSKRRGMNEVVEVLALIHAGNAYFDPDLLRKALNAPSTAREPRQSEPAELLTPRELEVLRKLVHGTGTSQMAASMGISVTTVRSHTQSVLTKLGANSRLQAAALAISRGLIDPPTP